MGVLDDAIRQHLELKRKHGAPEEELQRQEEEALGPARREVTAVDEAGAASDEAGAAPDHGELAEQAMEGDMPEATEPEPVSSEQAPAEEAVGAAAEEPLLEEPVTGEPAYTEREPEPDPRAEQTDRAEADAFESDAAEPPLRSGETPVHGFPALEDEGEEPAHADLEESAREDVQEAEDDEAEGGADVLEDTPDFLQETPEHDRLWFEQKPPRDFDFD
jgi:hypothetical protein